MRRRALLAAAALLLLAAVAAPRGARAADPAPPASFIAAAAPPRAPPPPPPAKPAARAVSAAAWPAPHYANYSLATSRDTFEICKNQSGLGREVSLEELPPMYGLPQSLLQHRRVGIGALSAALADAAPSARLVIAPLLAGEAELAPVLHPDGRLPRLVHFTVREKDGMLPHQALAIATWARLNPGYSLLLYDDADIAAFVAAYHPRHLGLFAALSSQVERTDLWRYLVLCTFGGVYADSDVVAGRPVAGWAQDAGLLAGVENVFDTPAAARARDYTGVMQVVQWAIAAAPGHPAICRMGDYIGARLAEEAGAAAAAAATGGAAPEADRDHAILERTGPGIWSRSVHDYIREHGGRPEDVVGGGKVGDLRLLPQSTFGCASSTVNLADPVAYVYHMFKGSWRLREPGRLWQFATHLYARMVDGPPGGGGGGFGALAPQEQRALLAGGEQAGGEAGAGGGRARERRLRAQLEARAGGGAGAAGPPRLDDGGAPGGGVPPGGVARDLRVLPAASLAAFAALACAAIVRGRRGGSGGGGRGGASPRASSGGGAARVAALPAVALAGVWAGAKRPLGLRGSSGGGGSASAPLLPLVSQQLPPLPPRGSAPPAAGAAAAAPAALERPSGASSTARGAGSSGGCLKRGSGSTQSLPGSSGGGMLL
ncbi:MAG: hypothetical protein J3K34DRAFT_499751 [Monoraphidium minutum]|nr:MAG: hypothetical protein J3K34DRAFT_499751 [Monoraphidium minutum]